MGQRMYLAVVWPAEKDYMLPTMRQLMAAWGTAYGSRVRVWSEADEGLVAVRAEIDLISVERLVYLLRTMRPTLNSLLGDEWAAGWAAGEEGADMRIRDLGPVIGRIIPADYEMYKEAILSAPGLVGCWFFDEGRGDKVLDASGYGNHGVIRGAKWVKLDGTWTLEFDGVDDYVAIPHDPSLNFGTGDFSIELWVKSSMPDGVNARLIGKYPSAYPSWFIIRRSTNVLEFTTRDQENDQITVTTPFSFDGVWHHIVAVKSAKTGYLYVDGMEKAASTNIDYDSADNTKSVLIAQFNNTDFLEGLISEVRIYARALSADEIARHHSLGRQFYPA